ncbi:MAG: DUF1156 domain-containing protein [bacterium]|nr:DUF1156 domain-containing protein [bacterium]
MGYRRKLIEVALPLDAISAASAREKSIRHGHPSTLHLWWARRPLAAARAVLWASLVDDPSAHPDRFPTEEDQAAERRRLFEILERLVVWENSNNPEALADARAEIEESCDGDLPNVFDPFCGGGTIPLEAQRLGLPAYGGDLNPVAVLISKALVEIPPKFAGLPPVNPDSRDQSGLKTWDRAQGLAEDIGYYGRWMLDRAFERIGHLYPKAQLPAKDGGGEANVIAWIWARTVQSPDPAWNGHVPLVRSWVLSKGKKNKPVVWVEPVIDRTTRTLSYEIREAGKPITGTIGRRGGVCVATGAPISFEYIADQGRRGLVDRAPLAVVAEGHRKRIFLPPLEEPPLPNPQWSPQISLPERTLGFRVQRYGMVEWDHLFAERQLVALATFSELLADLRIVVEGDARAAGLDPDGKELRNGGLGIVAYSDAVITYLAFVIDKCTNLWSSIVTWMNDRGAFRELFARQAIPMAWDYAEANPFSGRGGSWELCLDKVQKAVSAVPGRHAGDIRQRDAARGLLEIRDPVVCTDPPYYDNISYADISDFFYVWLRHNVGDIWPEEMATLLTPKAEELIANPYRAGSKEEARIHFEEGMAVVLNRLKDVQHAGFPATVFYAYKQQDIGTAGTASTGWEVFLQGLVDAGMQVTATWPIRTESPGRLLAKGTAALASSIVIACRTRPANAPLATRSELLDALARQLPKAVRRLQDQAIAPVDMAQSAIGPGMEVFSRFAKVLEADGTPMKVRMALSLINEALEEALSSEETAFDAPTRWALTWYEQYGDNAAPFGDAETLAKAKNTSVQSVALAGIADSRAGKVRLFKREEMERPWDSVADGRRTVWKVAQHLITCLDHSETDAADLLRQVGGGVGDRARRLAYLLYQIADRKGRSEDAVAYNGLIQSWHDIERRAAARQGPVAQTLEGI